MFARAGEERGEVESVCESLLVGQGVGEGRTSTTDGLDTGMGVAGQG